MSTYRTACPYCDYMGCDSCGGSGFALDPQPDYGKWKKDLEPIGSSVAGVMSTITGLMERSLTDGERALEDSQFSPAEMTLASELWKHELRPEQQAKIGPFYVDFLFREPMLVVEVDGSAFHQDRAKDASRTAYLLSHGVERVLRLRAIEVFTDPGGCVRAIKEALA